MTGIPEEKFKCEIRRFWERECEYRKALLRARENFANMPSGAYDAETVKKHLKDGSPENAEAFQAGLGILEIDEFLDKLKEQDHE